MHLTLQVRKVLTKHTAQRYQKASKKQKGRILDEFCATTGYTRSYARFILRNWGRKVKLTLNGVRTFYLIGGPSSKKKSRCSHPRKYDHRVKKALIQLWVIADGICGKRLAPFIRNTLPILERYEEIALDNDTREKLLSISPATIDRLLRSQRAKFQLKRRARTKPGTLLKHQIPIRTFSQWDEHQPGFVEIDLVSHDGGTPRGEFIQTLDVTDICTKWTETRAVKNKAQKWVFEALQDIIAHLPFQLRGIDSDNGGEFINAYLLRYCEAHKITFTRTRPYRKNDNCFVEQKNYSVVRKTVGYFKYDTPEELDLLNQIYRHLRLYTNFFLPAMNMIEKTRIGSKVRKKYDPPATPFHRVLAHPTVPEENKKVLRNLYAQLNPAELKRTICKLQDKLFDLAADKAHKQKQQLLHELKQKNTYIPIEAPSVLLE